LKFLKSFGTVGVSDIGSSAISSIFWLYLASLLSVSDYGEIQFFISIAGFSVGVALLGNGNTIIVYEIKKRGLRGILFLLTIGIGIVVSIILFFMYSRLDIIFLVFGMVFGELISGYLLGKKLFVRYGIIFISQKLLMVSLAIGFYFLIGFEGILYGIAISYIPITIIVFLKLKNSPLNFSELKQNFGFVINNYSNRLISQSRKDLDKIIIMPILGFEILGEFALSIQIYMVMILFASFSFKFLLFADAEKKNATKFKVSVLVISIVISILGILVGPEIIENFFPKYLNVLQIIPILSLAVIPSTVTIIFSSKFLGDEQGKFPLIGMIIYTISYLLMVVFLGSSHGLFGLGISFLISSTIYATYLVMIFLIRKQKKNR